MTLPPPTPPYGTTGEAAVTAAAHLATLDAEVAALVTHDGVLDAQVAALVTHDTSDDAALAALTSRMTAAEAALIALVPIGSVLSWATATAPAKWLLCYGQSLLRTDYAALFAVIGTTYGAADGTHFSLPDLRGRVVAGKDDMGGSSAARLNTIASTTLGTGGGAQTHTLSTAEMPAHTHTVDVYNGPGSGAQSGGTTFTAAWGGNSAGGGGAHNNIQPTFILSVIIYAGV